METPPSPTVVDTSWLLALGTFIPTAISAPLFLESAVLAPRDNLPCNNGANNGALEKLDYFLVASLNLFPFLSQLNLYFF
jgi:hypothetical protein